MGRRSAWVTAARETPHRRARSALEMPGLAGHDGEVPVCRALATKGAVLNGSKIRKTIEIFGESPGSRNPAFAEPIRA